MVYPKYRRFVDVIFTSAKKADCSSLFDVKLGESFWAKRNELVNVVQRYLAIL